MALNQPRSLGATLAKLFFGIGLALPLTTGVLSVAFVQLGLMNQTAIFPWDNILSFVFFLALIITPESICVYLFQTRVIKSFLARMAFAVIVVFLYADYIFLPPSVYTVLPETAATLVWAAWPPICALALGFVVGKIESRRVLS